jgi:hypothetical protein
MDLSTLKAGDIVAWECPDPKCKVGKHELGILEVKDGVIVYGFEDQGFAPNSHRLEIDGETLVDPIGFTLNVVEIDSTRSEEVLAGYRRFKAAVALGLTIEPTDEEFAEAVEANRTKVKMIKALMGAREIEYSYQALAAAMSIADIPIPDDPAKLYVLASLFDAIRGVDRVSSMVDGMMGALAGPVLLDILALDLAGSEPELTDESAPVGADNLN